MRRIHHCSLEICAYKIHIHTHEHAHTHAHTRTRNCIDSYCLRQGVEKDLVYLHNQDDNGLLRGHAEGYCVYEVFSSLPSKRWRTLVSPRATYGSVYDLVMSVYKSI